MSSNRYIALSNGADTIIYQVTESSSGTLCVLSAKLHESFKPIAVSGASPSNRSKFSLTAFSGTSFILIGGDGTAINSTEVWLFDTTSSKWGQFATTQDPIKRRSGHCSVSAGNIIYIFGGSNGLNICNDMIVITIQGSTFTYKEIESQNDWPHPRSQHTMTLMKNTIWLFGGVQDDGTVLNDLWELDYSLFPQSPSWHAVELRRAPAGRYSHVAWESNGDFFVAGGVGQDDAAYNEVWRFQNSWEQTSIIDCQFTLFACHLGLLEIGQTINEAKLLPPFAALNDLFERLKFKQTELTQLVSTQNWRASMASKSARDLGEFKKRIEQNESEKVLEFFSETERMKKIQQVNQMRNKLSVITAEIIKNYPRFLQHSLKNGNAEELTNQLLLNLQQCQASLEKTKAERKTEISLYQQHINFLKSQVPEPQLNIDPADFNTFLLYQKTLPREKHEIALQNYYRMQLREYQRLKQQTQSIQHKLKKASESQSKRTETVARLSEDLTKKFKSVTKAEEELKQWEKWYNEAVEDFTKVSTFISAIAEYQKSKPTLERSIASLEQNVSALQMALRRDLDDLVNKKKEPIDELTRKISALSEMVKKNKLDKSQSEAQNNIDVEYPNIQKLREAIIH